MSEIMTAAVLLKVYYHLRVIKLPSGKIVTILEKKKGSHIPHKVFDF